MPKEHASDSFNIDIFEHGLLQNNDNRKPAGYHDVCLTH